MFFTSQYLSISKNRFCLILELKLKLFCEIKINLKNCYRKEISTLVLRSFRFLKTLFGIQIDSFTSDLASTGAMVVVSGGGMVVGTVAGIADGAGAQLKSTGWTQRCPLKTVLPGHK